jgi:YbbR domain-containing protein
VNLLRHNFVEKALAAVLTLVVFWTVEQAQTPQQELVFWRTLEYENVPEKMRIVGEEPVQVRITAVGDPNVLEQLQDAKVRALVRLDNAMQGTATYKVLLEMSPDVWEAISWKVSPKQVELTLAGSRQVNVAVEAVPIKTPPAGFSRDAWIAEPDYVLVAGDQQAIRRIKRARILYDPTRRISPSELREIQLLDDRGRPVQGDFVVSPPKGRVVPSATTPVSKLVPVAPQWQGSLPAGYKLAQYSVQPAQVSVHGVSAILDSFSQIRTEPIDLSRITSDRSLSVPLVAPAEGVQLRRQSQVTVHIKLAPAENPG